MYPIAYEADFNPEPNRWTTFFRLLLAIPWLIVAIFWGILFAFTHLFAWVAIIILGRYPDWLYDFNTGVLRFGIRTGAWLYLQTDAWPPFGLSEDPNYPIRVNFPPRAERQSRLKALFRLILVVPLEIVIYLGMAGVHSGIAVVAWLTIVFRGYMPEAINSILTYVNGFYARFAGYFAFVTDDYPPIGLERAKPSGEQPPPPTPQAPTPPPPATA
jgi:hypothetical protein